MTTITMLKQPGSYYRMNGIIKAVRTKDKSPEVIEAIRLLKDSDHDILNIRESDLANAADYLLTGAEVDPVAHVLVRAAQTVAQEVFQG